MVWPHRGKRGRGASPPLRRGASSGTSSRSECAGTACQIRGAGGFRVLVRVRVEVRVKVRVKDSVAGRGLVDG